VDIHVHAQYGKSLSGQAVFRSTFQLGFHVTYEGLEPMDGIPLMIGQDFGRTPASLVAQIDPRGRLLILRESATSDGETQGIEKFATRQLRPMLYQYYTGRQHYMIADPSGKMKGQTNEESPFDALKRMGFMVYAAPTNDIEPRLRAVEQFFLQQSDGKALLLIDGVNCPLLVQALKFHYRYKRKQTGVLDEKPEKNHPWSDLADCLHYLCLAANGNYVGNLIARSRPRAKGPTLSAASWT
jgi:hypothetical protein